MLCNVRKVHTNLEEVLNQICLQIKSSKAKVKGKLCRNEVFFIEMYARSCWKSMNPNFRLLFGQLVSWLVGQSVGWMVCGSVPKIVGIYMLLVQHNAKL